jgi:hypothetical protein
MMTFANARVPPSLGRLHFILPGERLTVFPFSCTIL